jgi:hypothetical protein
MYNSDISLAQPVTWQNLCLQNFERAKIVFKNNTKSLRFEMTIIEKSDCYVYMFSNTLKT